MKVTPKQRDILDFAYDWIHISYPSLTRFLNISPVYLRQLLFQLRSNDMVYTTRLRGEFHRYLHEHVDYGYAHLTSKSLKQYGVNNSTEGESQERHNIAASALASYICHLAPNFNMEINTVKGCRSSRNRYRRENEKGMVRYVLKPDGTIELYQGNKMKWFIFIETDTGHEDLSEIAEKLKRYESVLEEREMARSMILFSVFKKARCESFLTLLESKEISPLLNVCTQHAVDIVKPSGVNDIKVLTKTGEKSLFLLEREDFE